MCCCRYSVIVDVTVISAIAALGTVADSAIHIHPSQIAHAYLQAVWFDAH